MRIVLPYIPPHKNHLIKPSPPQWQPPNPTTMDPLSATASIAGILTICGQISNFLHTTLETIGDAPEAASSMLSRTNGVRLLLKQLQATSVGLIPSSASSLMPPESHAARQQSRRFRLLSRKPSRSLRGGGLHALSFGWR